MISHVLRILASHNKFQLLYDEIYNIDKIHRVAIPFSLLISIKNIPGSNPIKVSDQSHFTRRIRIIWDPDPFHKCIEISNLNWECIKNAFDNRVPELRRFVLKTVL